MRQPWPWLESCDFRTHPPFLLLSLFCVFLFVFVHTPTCPRHSIVLSPSSRLQTTLPNSICLLQTMLLRPVG